MSTISELFGDEISDIKQRVKSEEEIKKYSTNEDLGELKRSIYILKKGYQSQKITIIENLNRLMKEQGANEELLPIILSSMEIWDEQMQMQCAQSFCKDDVIRNMNGPNQLKLMEECLNILLNADITHEDFVNQWIQVFKRLVIYIPIDNIKQLVIKRIMDLPSLKQQYPWRRVGFELFCGLIDAKGEEILKQDQNIMKVFSSMCVDTNWKIRKQAAQFLFQYLQPLHQMKKKNRHSSKDEDTPKKKDINMQNQQQGPPEILKVTKTRFKSHFHDILVELAHDEEILVQIEGVELMTEFLHGFKKQTIESDYIPNVDKVFKKALDTVTVDDIRLRVTQYSGKILDQLQKCSLALKYEEIMMEFFRLIMKDKNPEVKLKGVYNLPCFIHNYMNAKESNFEIFEDIYIDLMKDESVNQLEIKKILAASIHEIIALIPHSQSLGAIGDCLKKLMTNSTKETREVFAQNIDKIIKYYVKEKDYQVHMQLVNKSQTAINMGQSALSGGKDTSYKNSKAFQFQTEDLSSGMRTGTGQRQNRKNIFKWEDDSQTIQNGSGDKNQYVRLQDYVDIEYVPEENMKEFYYSKLLDDILILTRAIFNDKGCWRVQEQFIWSFASQLNHFNSLEIYENLGYQMIELLKNGCEQIKNASALFICQMINHQYKLSRKNHLIDQIINEFGKSKSYIFRKSYISFCSHAVKVFSVKVFKHHFMEPYLALCTDKIVEVRQKFLQSAPMIRPYLEHDIDLML